MYSLFAASTGTVIDSAMLLLVKLKKDRRVTQEVS